MTFPVGPRAVHLCIDMQRMFAEATEWHTPTLAAILPNVSRIAEAKPERALFARFTVPETADRAHGAWRDYSRRWDSLTGSRIDPGLVDLVAPLATVSTAQVVVDKPTYSVFGADELETRLQAMNADTLVLTGVETDICVLATVFDAVDKGYRTVVVSDAVTSAALDSHDAVIRTLLPRLPQQVAIMTTRELLAQWTD